MENHFDPNNNWRKVAAAIYRKPVDAKIFGTIELDVTELEEFVKQKREEGLKITLMHPMILFFARALKHEVPQLNCYVKRGRIVHRENVDVMVSVLQRDSDQMGSVKVPDADTLTLTDLTSFLAREVAQTRKGAEKGTSGQKSLLAVLPWPFRAWFVRMIQLIVVDWGIPLPGVSISTDSFGSFVFSNVGSIGIDIAYPALFPVSNVAMVVTMGSAQTKPAVVDGQIVPRRLLNLSAAFDHRIVDASHGGKLFRYLKNAIKHPEVL